MTRTALGWIALACMVAVPLHIAWRLVVAVLGGAPLAMAEAALVAFAYMSGVVAGHVWTKVTS